MIFVTSVSIITLILITNCFASTKSANHYQISVITTSMDSSKMVFSSVRTQSDCSIFCLKNGSSLFYFDESTSNCSFGNITTNILEVNPELGSTLATKVWLNSAANRTPHFFIVSGTAVTDLSLDPSVSPNVNGNAIWKFPSVNGRGRIVNNWFHICGGGAMPNVHRNCTRRMMGDTTATNDVILSPEPSLHSFRGSSLMVGDTQWQTGGTGIDNVTGNIDGETTFWHANGTFSAGPKLPIPVIFSCMVQYNANTTFLVGGLQVTNNNTLNVLYKYDWTTNTWTLKSGMLEQRCGHLCWLVEYPPGSGNKSLLVGGGLQTCPTLTGGLNSSEIYDFEKDLWTVGPILPTFRGEGCSVTLNNRYFWFGGKTATTTPTLVNTATILEYSPLTGWFTSSLALTATASNPIVIPYNI